MRLQDLEGVLLNQDDCFLYTFHLLTDIPLVIDVPPFPCNEKFCNIYQFNVQHSFIGLMPIVFIQRARPNRGGKKEAPGKGQILVCYFSAP